MELSSNRVEKVISRKNQPYFVIQSHGGHVLKEILGNFELDLLDLGDFELSLRGHW